MCTVTQSQGVLCLAIIAARRTETACRNEAKCDGVSAVCPITFKPNTTPCRWVKYSSSIALLLPGCLAGNIMASYGAVFVLHAVNSSDSDSGRQCQTVRKHTLERALHGKPGFEPGRLQHRLADGWLCIWGAASQESSALHDMSFHHQHSLQGSCVSHSVQQSSQLSQVGTTQQSSQQGTGCHVCSSTQLPD